MNNYNQMILDGKFKEIEELILSGVLSLDALSEEAYELFKNWIEQT